MRINQAGPKDDDDDEQRQVPPTETWGGEGGERVVRADGHTQSETTISPHFWLLTNLCRETRRQREAKGETDGRTKRLTERRTYIHRESGGREAQRGKRD